MKPISRWMAALAVTMFSAASHAVPVHVTQTFHDVTWDHQGYTNSVGFGQVISGDWVFNAVFDSEAPNACCGGDVRGSYALDSITLTQASLGLFDAPILNLSYLGFFMSSAGFGFATDPLVYPRVSSAFGQLFDGSNPFADGHPFTTVAGGRLRAEDEGFLFGDGSRIFGGGFAGSTTIGAVVAPVPEPETWLGLMIGLGALVAGRTARKRQAASLEPSGAH